MKKIVISIFSLIILISLMFNTNVYAASLSLSTSKSEVSVGDKVSVTVSFGQKVAAADVSLTFDSSKFTYQSVSSGTANASGSTVNLSYYDSTGGSSPISSITFTFTAKSTGSGTFKAKCSSAADSDVNSLTISGSPSKSVTVKEKSTSTSNNSSSSNTNSSKNTTNSDATETEATKSSNANLSSIEIEGFSLTPEFNEETTTYYLAVNQDIDTLNITANAADTTAQVEISGNSELQFGTNTVTIKVTAEDGTVKDYIIEVNKEDTSLALSSLLVSLNSEYLELTPEFDKGTLNYTLNVENVSELNIEAFANYEDATITITGNENLKDGENIIIITVQKDEEIVEYSITVNNNVDSLFEIIGTFFKNNWLVLLVSICSLLQSSIAIYYASLAYKNSNLNK